MHQVAQRNDTIRFVRMSNEDAEILPFGVPSVLAYKGGDQFANIVALEEIFTAERELSALSMETLFREYVICPSPCGLETRTC